MAITVPIVGQEISASTFGIPVANEVNRLTPLVDAAKANDILVGGIWRRVAALSVPNGTYVTVTYDAEDLDTHGFMPANGNSVTIPAGCAGIYGISFTGSVGATGALHLIPNDGVTIESGTPDAASGWCTVTVIRRMQVGESFYTRFWQNSGAATNASNCAKLSVFRVATL